VKNIFLVNVAYLSGQPSVRNIFLVNVAYLSGQPAVSFILVDYVATLPSPTHCKIKGIFYCLLNGNDSIGTVGDLREAHLGVEILKPKMICWMMVKLMRKLNMN